MRDRHPDSTFPPGFGVLVATTVMFLIAVPPLGMVIGMVAVLVWMRRRGRVHAARRVRQQRRAERLEREQIAAYRSL